MGLTNGLSLKSLAADLLNVPLDKSLELRCSDWEADQLTLEQVFKAWGCQRKRMDTFEKCSLIIHNFFIIGTSFQTFFCSLCPVCPDCR